MAEIERVIKDLEKVKDGIEWDSPLEYQITIDEAIQTIRELQEQIPKWHLCSEELPNDRRSVLVCAYGHETYQVMEGSYYGDGLWWCVPFNNCGEHMQKLKPKAWMELPRFKEVE